MDSIGADLRAYYEEEARRRLRSPLKGRRVELRDGFLALLQAEGRRSVVDFGAGPGGDGHAFVAAGVHFVGLDLARGNGVLAAEHGLTVVQGSVAAPPFRHRSFDAGWSMSTLMHLPEDHMTEAVRAMANTLRPGAPLQIGLWGGALGDVIDDTAIEGQRRLFSLRTMDHNRRLLSANGTVERHEVWDVTLNGQEYQTLLLRVHG